MNKIEIVNVSKVYPAGDEAVTALSDVSLTIKSGEFIAVTGPSGCGKSTLLHTIGGLDEPSSGNIYVCGKPLYQKSKSELALFRRTNIGIVYQFYNLVPELTAEENLVLPAILDRRKIEKKEIEGILDFLGMTEKRNFYPGQLSGGQQQKIAIGRALIKRPFLLLADEPSGNLDSAKRDEILQLFHYLNEHEAMTILLVTHDHFVAQSAKRKICMLDGRIVQDEAKVRV